MKEIEPLKLSYSECKIPVFPSLLFIFCIEVIICFLYSKLGLSEQEIKKNTLICSCYFINFLDTFIDFNTL